MHRFKPLIVKKPYGGVSLPQQGHITRAGSSFPLVLHSESVARKEGPPPVQMLRKRPAEEELADEELPSLPTYCEAIHFEAVPAANQQRQRPESEEEFEEKLAKVNKALAKLKMPVVTKVLKNDAPMRLQVEDANKVAWFTFFFPDALDLIIKLRLPSIVILPVSEVFKELLPFVHKAYLYKKGREVYEGKPPIKEDCWALYLDGCIGEAKWSGSVEDHLTQGSATRGRRRRRKNQGKEYEEKVLIS